MYPKFKLLIFKREERFIFNFCRKIEYSGAFAYFRMEMLTCTPSDDGIKWNVWNLKI